VHTASVATPPIEGSFTVSEPRDGQRVAVVTDSTADLSAAMAEDLDLRVVPMSVTFGNETFISGVTIDDEEFYRRLDSAPTLPTTAQPNPHWFLEAWQDAADDGHEAVVSLHVSRELSGTVSQARRLAATATLPITVVDSRQVGGGLALMVLAAQRAARANGTSSEVVLAARRVGEQVVNRVVVATMENLRRGGRVSGPQALVGRALRVRPILGVQDGAIVPMGRTRTQRRAFDDIAHELLDAFGDVPMAAVVTHAVAPSVADMAVEVLDEALDLRQHHIQVFGPVLGTHAGEGAVAIAAVPAALVAGPSGSPDTRDAPDTPDTPDTTATPGSPGAARP